ncbi:saxitoxin and tetrodotoxin-binding protein 1-like [Clinocottus analis]|uniref:saxitoxin and tetrodotoxin-binding protein 1-like n=1 Tax=Clinocottus analis TaxID=304258 RepID=UPI0035C13863
MSAVKRAVLLLLVAIGTNAAPTSEDCHRLKNQSISDLNEVMGDWVLVWSVATIKLSNDVMQKLSSSHAEMRMHHDNHTILLTERHLLHDKSCRKDFMNFTIDESGNHTLDCISATVEIGGIVSPFNESEQVDFYQSCSECMTMLYSSRLGRHLLIYRKEGHHHDLEEMKSHHDANRKMAECLGIPHDREFIYDGVADFCHKKSSPEADAAASAAPVLS